MESKNCGSDYFGKWITDEFGLPAYNYTCNQLIDEKAKTITNDGHPGPYPSGIAAVYASSLTRTSVFFLIL